MEEVGLLSSSLAVVPQDPCAILDALVRALPNFAFACTAAFGTMLAIHVGLWCASNICFEGRTAAKERFTLGVTKSDRGLDFLAAFAWIAGYSQTLGWTFAWVRWSLLAALLLAITLLWAWGVVHGTYLRGLTQLYQGNWGSKDNLNAMRSRCRLVTFVSSLPFFLLVLLIEWAKELHL